MEAPLPGTGVVTAITSDSSLRVRFTDGSAREIPYSWLRHNCRCHKCLPRDAAGVFSSENLNMEVHPEIIQSNEFGVVVDWSDGHISKYPGVWLHDNAIMPSPRAHRRHL